MKKTFYSNGKLLFTGEYTVLDGANAFAAPTKYGQYLEVEGGTGTNTIEWLSYDADGTVWLKTKISLDAVINNTPLGTIPEVDTLINVLHHAHAANPALLLTESGFKVITKLTFPRHWGLGTSSTFINNIAQWFGINAYKLLADSFGGSGYDIACAQHNTALLYKINENGPVVTQVNFNPSFKDSIWFVYLNQKQNSREAITAYKQQRQNIGPVIDRIDSLTNDALLAQDLQSFSAALEKHEDLLAGVLGIVPIQEQLFPDFKGIIKSLGAWGGDFVMAIAEENPANYFKDREYETVIEYRDMIL